MLDETARRYADRITTAMDEARRFLKAAEAALERIYPDDAAPDYSVLISGSKETAAAKRASLDLTRALACFRRGHC